MIKKTPEDVAAFLYKGEGLNKTAIGDYLGEKSDFNEAVLKAFVELHDFTDLILVQALRQFLWSFRYFSYVCTTVDVQKLDVLKCPKSRADFLKS